MEFGELALSKNPDQVSYIAGTLGLSLDRIHIERTHNELMDLIAFADGRSLLEISELINVPVWELLNDLHVLETNKLIECELS